jgi:hypothetical protein
MALNSVTANPLDDPFYYLNNFRQVLDWLELRYADVMSESEQASFATSRPAARVAGAAGAHGHAQGRAFPAGKLITRDRRHRERRAAIVEHGWLDDQALLSVAEVFDVLLKAELLQAFGQFIDQPKGRKDDWLPALAGQFSESRSLCDWAPTLGDRLLSLTIMDLCDRLRLMFFGNLYQDWSEFVLADLGIFTYEKVEFCADSRGLRSREDVDACLFLHQCQQRFEAGEALAEVVEQVSALH